MRRAGGQITGKALMLDEIINYVQSLQRQVEVMVPLQSSERSKAPESFSSDDDIEAGLSVI